MGKNTDMKRIKIHFTSGKTIDFIGKYRPDLEKKNWHYHENEYGNILHCRKEHMILVMEGE